MASRETVVLFRHVRHVSCIDALHMNDVTGSKPHGRSKRGLVGFSPDHFF